MRIDDMLILGGLAIGGYMLYKSLQAKAETREHAQAPEIPVIFISPTTPKPEMPTTKEPAVVQPVSKGVWRATRFSTLSKPELEFGKSVAPEFLDKETFYPLSVGVTPSAEKVSTPTKSVSSSGKSTTSKIERVKKESRTKEWLKKGYKFTSEFAKQVDTPILRKGQHIVILN